MSPSRTTFTVCPWGLAEVIVTGMRSKLCEWVIEHHRDRNHPPLQSKPMCREEAVVEAKCIWL